MAAILPEVNGQATVAEKNDSPGFVSEGSPKEQFMLQDEEKPVEAPLVVTAFEPTPSHNFTMKVAHKSHVKRERIKPTGSGRRLSYSTEIDEKLLHWVKKFQENKVNVTREMLQKQALSLIQPECPDFKASSGWVEKFLVRHGLTLPGMSRSLNNIDRSHRQGEEHFSNGTSASMEPVIREPPNLNEILSNVNVSSPGVKEEDEENDDDDDDDLEDHDMEGKKPSNSSEINPERLKAFNMFVRLFVDENLDRLVPISKQPKEKINAIIVSCQRQFPEFSDRARKRIRTYLKSCRRSSRMKEPAKRSAENMSVPATHIPSTQLGEVNNILSQACFNESQEVAKRAKYDPEPGIRSSDKSPIPGQKYVPFSSASRTPPVKLSESEVTAVRQLISGYRESAAFLYRSADELENLLRHSEQYYGQQQQQSLS